MLASVCAGAQRHYAGRGRLGLGELGSMKTLLGIVVFVAACLLLGEAGHAQGSCSGICADASSMCQRRVADLGAVCRRQYGSVARYATECQRQEQTYARACGIRYRQCLQACRGR